MRWFKPDKTPLCLLLMIHAQLCKAIDKQADLINSGTVGMVPEFHHLVNTISGVIERLDK